MEEEREMCQNCKKDIPVTNYRMHTLHCARNMVKCGECDLMVGKENMELHNMEFHSLRVCDQCQVSIEAYKLPEHKKTLCSKRKLICKYCNQPKMAMEMSDHETYCGSRAERCDRCPDWVQLKEWDSHQSRYHATVQRRFRERSVIAQTETIIDYNASKIHNGENDRNVNNVSSSNAASLDPMLPCEFCDGLVPMRKLLEHQAACVNPTNVRRNDSSCNSSCTSSFRSTSGRPQGLGQKLKKLSCAEQMALESPIPSPDMSASKKSASLESRRKISAPASYQSTGTNPTSCAAQIAAEEAALAETVAADEAENGAEKTKVPCEFCNEPCSLEALMRHQHTCKKNPHIKSQDSAESPNNNGRRQRHYSLSRTQSVRETSEIERPLRALSRQNSFSDRSYLRRSESFYGRNAMTLGSTYRSTYTSTDYASAVRRTSLFDGYSGFSIYSSISQGLDEITYGGRRSRRGSVGPETNTYSYSSRRGSVSASNAGDYAALMAATAALEATSNNPSKQNEKQQPPVTTESESGLGNSPKSINLSRQNSTRMSNMSDSAYGEDYESSGSPGGVTMHKIQKSSSVLTTSTSTTKKTSSSSEVAVIKHSKSSAKLERKVSFSEADPIKIGCIAADATKSMVSNNNNKIIECNNNIEERVISPAKPPKRSKDKKDKEKIKSKAKKSASSSKVTENEFVDQVNAKLRLLEQQQQKTIPAAEVVEVIDHPNSLDISATIKLSPKMNQRPKSQQNNPASVPAISQEQRPKSQQNNPAITAILQDLVATNEGNGQTVKQREKVASRIGSKRNSLDKQSVQTLAQDLAAECAKAYALMENSLSKLSSELGVTPFGLAPKNKKLRKSSSTSTASRPQSAASAI